MKAIFINSLLICALSFTFCGQSSVQEVPVEKPEEILRSFESFWQYNHDHIKWTEEFTAYDVNSKAINKEEFLLLVSTGKYLPLRLKSETDLLWYKLYELDPFSHEEFQSTLRSLAALHYKRYKMEGKRLPGFNFVDIDGNSYNDKTIAGKIVVINCWFIRCAPCRAEMPALNHLVKRYRNRDDVLFLSLALDSKKELQDFLANTTFKYAVVSDQEPYLEETLQIGQYPTQILINKEGLVVKVLDTDKEIAALLDKESSK
jgi:thiol-disulfide isomerase/thioredoxin